jgi:hypothetical protein
MPRVRRTRGIFHGCGIQKLELHPNPNYRHLTIPHDIARAFTGLI